MDIADRVRDLRVAAGLSKTALARPRYTVSFVSQIEAGRRRPSPDAMAFFAGRLGVSPRYLQTGIPDDLESELRFKLEEARHALLEREASEAEAMVLSIRARAEEYGLSELRTQALVLEGEVRLRQQRLSQAVDIFEEALDGEPPERAAGQAVWGLARAHRTAGDLTYAAEVVESFLKKDRSAPLDPTVAAQLQSTLVSIYFERGDVLRAQRAAEHALAAAAQGASLEIRAETYWHASRVLAEARRWDEALDSATKARALMEELQDRRSVGQLHVAYAFICLEVDPPKVKDAGKHLKKAETLFEDAGQPGDLSHVYTEWSRLAVMQGDFEEALSQAERAEAVTPPDNQLQVANCLFLKGRALGELARKDEARQALTAAASTFHEHGARQQEAACWREVGELELADGRMDASVDALRAGLEALDPGRART